MAIEVLCCWLTNHVGAANESFAMLGMPHSFIVAYSMTGAVEARPTAVFVSGTVIDAG